MTSPLEQAGAVKEPSEYAALSMDRSITGLWTQRSPLRDADVPYLYGKFYSASRFDSLIDGINREITSKLTYKRRPGNSVFNTNSFPPANSIYSYSRITSGNEVVRVIYDGQDGTIYDATPGQKSTIFVKSSGAGKARFQGVNTELFFTDGVENKKWLQPGPWSAQTSILTTELAVGDIILDGNGAIEFLLSFQVGTVTNVQVASNVVILTFSGTNFSVTQGMSFSLTLGTATFLNGIKLFAQSVVPSGSTFIVTASFAHAPYASTADSGPAVTNDIGAPATTGATVPTWTHIYGHQTTDGLSTWFCYNNSAGFYTLPVYDWQPPGPVNAPTIAAVSNGTTMTIWQPLTLMAARSIVLGVNGLINGTLAGGRTGNTLPLFSDPSWPVANPIISDGGVSWQASNWLGGGTVPAPWQKSIAVTSTNNPGGDCIVDPNGNLQMAANGTGSTGTTQPTWNTAYGGSTTDSGITWVNFGPYFALAFQGRQYAYAFHCIDGSVTSLSPLSPSTNGVLDGVTISALGAGYAGGGGGANNIDPQMDSVWIFHTADGESTPLFLTSIPNPGSQATWTFTDQSVDELLIAELPGPQGDSNDPPPVGMTAPIYHLGRIFAIYENGVIGSGGPNVLVGNGNTAFNPAFFFPVPEQPIRLFSAMTSAGPAILIWCRSNIYSILGQGTTTSPFQQASRYMADCGIQSYDAVTQIGSTYYAFGDTALVGGNIVGKAFSLDPATGYVEYGFPIGDQFESVTTGAGGEIPNSGVPLGYLYNPANTFVTWAQLGSGDTALYVCDGSIGWFRYSPVASPESGFLWSPRAVIVGGTSAVQAIVTQPGVTQLLIAPASTGQILFRDRTVNQDNGVSYPSYDVKGCIQLCVSGEVGEVAHVHVISMPEGKRPKVGLLFGEIIATTAAPFSWYSRTSSEPPTLAPSQSLYSDRYTMLSKGVTPKCLFFQLGMDYGTQNFPDETLMFSVYGAKYAERKQQ